MAQLTPYFRILCKNQPLPKGNLSSVTVKQIEEIFMTLTISDLSGYFNELFCISFKDVIYWFGQHNDSDRAFRNTINYYRNESNVFESDKPRTSKSALPTLLFKDADFKMVKLNNNAVDAYLSPYGTVKFCLGVVGRECRAIRLYFINLEEKFLTMMDMTPEEREKEYNKYNELALEFQERCDEYERNEKLINEETTDLNIVAQRLARKQNDLYQQTYVEQTEIDEDEQDVIMGGDPAYGDQHVEFAEDMPDNDIDLNINICYDTYDWLLKENNKFIRVYLVDPTKISNKDLYPTYDSIYGERFLNVVLDKNWLSDLKLPGDFNKHGKPKRVVLDDFLLVEGKDGIHVVNGIYIIEKDGIYNVVREFDGKDFITHKDKFPLIRKQLKLKSNAIIQTDKNTYLVKWRDMVFRVPQTEDPFMMRQRRMTIENMHEREEQILYGANKELNRVVNQRQRQQANRDETVTTVLTASPLTDAVVDCIQDPDDPNQTITLYKPSCSVQAWYWIRPPIKSTMNERRMSDILYPAEWKMYYDFPCADPEKDYKNMMTYFDHEFKKLLDQRREQQEIEQKRYEETGEVPDKVHSYGTGLPPISSGCIDMETLEIRAKDEGINKKIHRVDREFIESALEYDKTVYMRMKM